MLRFSKFEKSYKNISVLQIDDLSLEPGLYWIKGANGSGKSTLLKSIAGILTFKGDILLGEKISVKKQSFDYRKLVNFAEAEPLFPEFLTGREMISLFSEAKNASKKQQEFLIESMNIQNYIHQPVSTFSTGMLKKLSLVLAFLGNPKLILLDEPLITIDKDAIETVYCWIKENCRNGVNFMLTTHQDLEIERLSFARELIVISQTLRLNS
jgi:ABC-2 type transport system ATP-binding protein